MDMRVPGLLLIVIFLCLGTACSRSYYGDWDRWEISSFIDGKINSRDFTVRVDYIQKGRNISISSGYGVTVEGSQLISYLPFYGRAYNVPYGGGDALNFTGEITRYTVDKKGDNSYDVRVVARTNEDTYQYIFKIYDNGTTYLNVIPTNREAINFSGYLSNENR